MTTGINEALLLVIIMAAAIYFCRVFPFLFFRGKNSGAANANGATGANAPGAVAPKSGRSAAFLAFVEKTVPPVAMTVLTFNSLAGSVKSNPQELIPALAAAVFTAAVHLWRRNPLISIFGGTALYMVLIRVSVL